MNLYGKFKNYCYAKRCKKRYKKFKNCSLPYPFWDERRDTFEWVYYDHARGYFEVNSELNEQLANIAFTGLTYHYEANLFSYNKNELYNKMTESHGHNFNEVVKVLYNYPESFKIPEDCLSEYSEQQLRYLKRVQKYLLFIGLKDFTMNEEQKELLKKTDELYDKQRKSKSIIDKIKYNKSERLLDKLRKKEELERCKNSNVLKYADCFYMHFDSKEVLDAILNGKISYRIFRYCGSRKNHKYFLVDNEENYYGVIEFFEEEKIKFKDIKENIVEYKVRGYKTFKEYKNKLYNDFLEDSKWFKEVFNENSEVLYAKFKVIEKF